MMTFWIEMKSQLNFIVIHMNTWCIFFSHLDESSTATNRNLKIWWSNVTVKQHAVMTACWVNLYVWYVL